MTPFFNIYISQGSVATCLRHGRIFKDELAAKFTTESVSEKKFENRLIFGRVIGKSLMSCFFLTHSVISVSLHLASSFATSAIVPREW